MHSWKGDISKSGGVATNIGVHFFDMLFWTFGRVRRNIVHIRRRDKAAGLLELEKARVRWFLSLDGNDLPFPYEPGKATTYRSITIDGEEIDFSDGFGDLHTESYRKILQGQGFGTDEIVGSVEIAHHIRNVRPIGIEGDCHRSASRIKEYV